MPQRRHPQKTYLSMCVAIRPAWGLAVGPAKAARWIATESMSRRNHGGEGLGLGRPHQGFQPIPAESKTPHRRSGQFNHRRDLDWQLSRYAGTSGGSASSGPGGVAVDVSPEDLLAPARPVPGTSDGSREEPEGRGDAPEQQVRPRDIGPSRRGRGLPRPEGREADARAAAANRAGARLPDAVVESSPRA